MDTFLNFRHRIVIRLLQFFPQIQMVALCNSRAMGEAVENSDIDLFIITKKRNLWTARFLVTFFSTLLFVRRRNTHGLEKGSPQYICRTKDKFCLSFFVTEEHLDLSDIRLQPADPYLDRWIYTLIPLVNKHATYEHFIEANGIQQKEKRIKKKDGIFIKYISFIIYYLLSIISFFEGFIKRIWLRKTLHTYDKLGRPWGVVISDTMLKFHDRDVRREYIEL